MISENNEIEYQKRYDSYVQNELPKKCGVGASDGVEPTNVCALYEIIKPMFEVAAERDKCLQCVLTTDFEANYFLMRSNVDTWFKLVHELQKSTQAVQDLRIEQIVHLVSYMVACESLYAMIAEWFCFIVVKAGKPKNHGSIFNATDIDSIRPVPLQRKLNFLNDNKLGIFSMVCDTNIRNAIAHFTFNIDDDGKVYILDGSKKVQNINVQQEYQKLRSKAIEGRLAIGMYYSIKFGTDKWAEYYSNLTEEQIVALRQLTTKIIQNTPDDHQLLERNTIQHIVGNGMEKGVPFDKIINDLKMYCSS